MKITRALITSVLLGSLLVAAPVASFAAPGGPGGPGGAPRVENRGPQQHAPAAPRREPEPPRRHKKSNGAAVGGALLLGLAVGTAIGSSSN